MPEPCPRTPNIPLIDPTPAINKLLRHDPLLRKIPHVLERLVDDVDEDLQESQDVEGFVRGRVFQRLRPPCPEGEKTEEAQGEACFGHEGGEGEEAR